MLAALLEWLLWLAAFMYCLIKVFQKAETASIKVLAVVMMILFTLLRWVQKFKIRGNPTDWSQSNLLAHHDRHAAPAFSNRAILSRIHG